MASKNEDLVGELESWGAANRVSKDPYVAGLLNAMRTGEGLAAYSELSPVEYLPQPENRTDDRAQKIATYLTIIRNILVFFPVALTWIAVSKSTTAFAAYVTANKGSVVNFLEFWQDGYGVLSRSWTIGHIAFLDFAIIMSVLTENHCTKELKIGLDRGVRRRCFTFRYVSGDGRELMMTGRNGE